MSFPTTNEGHGEHLRQAYGFQSADNPFAARSIVYPVGVGDIDMEGWSTFHHTAASNDTAVLSDIISQDGFEHLESRTEILDGHQFTPLLCAVKGDAIDTFHLLVRSGADIEATDCNGLSLVEIAVKFNSTEVFSHLLEHGYEHKGVEIWATILSLLCQRDHPDMRAAAMEMVGEILSRDTEFVGTFVRRGGLIAVKDILTDLVNSSRNKEKTDLELSLIRVGDGSRPNVLFARTLSTLNEILENMTSSLGEMLKTHYKELVSLLLRIVNRASDEDPFSMEEGDLAGECLERIARARGWGVTSLTKTSIISSLLRSVLLDSTVSNKPFEIIRAAYSSEPGVLLESIGTTEIEVILSILHTEKRIYVKKFFVAFLTDLFRSGRSKHHLYSGEVIATLLSGLATPDTELNSRSLELLLLISTEDKGLQCIFQSPNTFITLVNRVLLETERRFDLCCKLLWKLIHSFRDLQNSVKVIENMGVSTVIGMLGTEDNDVKCIGTECIRILLNSNSFDYRAQLIRKDVHTTLICLLKTSTAGHVLHSVMSCLAELSVSYSSYHPVPAVQNAMIQSDGLKRIIQIAQANRLTNPTLQTTAYLLIAATLLGNQMVEMRLSEYDLTIEEDLRQQTKHSDQTLSLAIKAITLFRYHSLIVDNGTYKFSSTFDSGDSLSIFNNVLWSVCQHSSVKSGIIDLLEDKSEHSLIYLASLSKIKECATVIVDQGLPPIIDALYTGTLRERESAATLLASISYFERGMEELLIESHEDPVLLASVTETSPNVPLYKNFQERSSENTARDHRRRVLSKQQSRTGDKAQRKGSPLKLPDIGTNSLIYGQKPVSRQKSRGHEETNKTPIPGDFGKIDTVRYTDITTMGLTRPYSKVDRLPSVLLSNEGAGDTDVASYDKSLYRTVDRLYKKLYLRPATQASSSRPATTALGREKTQQSMARTLSFVF